MLGGRIEAVARGSDPAYSDAVFRSTIGAFYGAYNNATFQRQLKENRKIEELIITFVSTATSVLRKRMPGDEWKGHLMSQVAFFVGLIRDGLKEVKHVPPELLSRLNIYLDRLGPPIPSSTEPGNDAPPAPPAPTATSAAASELVRQVALVFNVQEEQLKRDIAAIKRFCTEKV